MKKSILYLIVLSLLMLLACAGYFFFVRNEVIAAYKGDASAWFNTLIDYLYPRFNTEKHRFPVEFFLNKTDQIIIRTVSIVVLGLLFTLIYQYYNSFRNKISNYFNATTTAANVAILRVIVYSYLIYTSWDLYLEYQQLRNMESFYKPILLLKILHFGFPSNTLFLFLFILFITSSILAIFNIKTVLSAVICISSFLVLYGFHMSFEKTDHGFATINYCLILFPFLLYERDRTSTGSTVQAWALQLIRLVIPLCYFLSGCEKLLNSGSWWLKAENFRAFLYMHDAPLGKWIAESDLLCTILPVAALLFQLGFISILFNKKLIPYFIVAGIFFHTGNWLLFDIGGYANPWMAVYIFFIDWNFLARISFVNKLLQFRRQGMARQ